MLPLQAAVAVWETMLGLDLDGARLGTVDRTRQGQLDSLRHPVVPDADAFAEGQIKLFSVSGRCPSCSSLRVAVGARRRTTRQPSR